jgi:hypothetical protein
VNCDARYLDTPASDLDQAQRPNRAAPIARSSRRIHRIPSILSLTHAPNVLAHIWISSSRTLWLSQLSTSEQLA